MLRWKSSVFLNYRILLSCIFLTVLVLCSSSTYRGELSEAQFKFNIWQWSCRSIPYALSYSLFMVSIFSNYLFVAASNFENPSICFPKDRVIHPNGLFFFFKVCLHALCFVFLNMDPPINGSPHIPRMLVHEASMQPSPQKLTDLYSTIQCTQWPVMSLSKALNSLLALYLWLFLLFK